MTSVLTVNAGSSSSRLAAYRLTGSLVEPVAQAHANTTDRPDRDILRDFMESHGLDGFDIVAHRVVHGGTRLTQTCWLSEEIEQEVLDLAPWAPLHNPRAVDWMRTCRSLLGDALCQAAVFDTAFFAALPPVASTYALPKGLPAADGVRRFGFHGLAHRFMADTWAQLKAGDGQRNGGRIITIQLGAGCSITAICDGRPVDTSMGATPLEGLVMASRSGDVDPGLLLHLQQYGGMSAADLDHILNHESGLRGLSGRSGDMRELLAADDADSALAVGVYCYRVRKYIGAYLAALGGADAILFGGGVGEHAPEVRRRILTGLEGLGIAFDATLNEQMVGRRGSIGAPGSSIELWVTPVDEAAVLVGEVQALLARGANSTGRGNERIPAG